MCQLSMLASPQREEAVSFLMEEQDPLMSFHPRVLEKCSDEPCSTPCLCLSRGSPANLQEDKVVMATTQVLCDRVRVAEMVCYKDSGSTRKSRHTSCFHIRDRGEEHVLIT